MPGYVASYGIVREYAAVESAGFKMRGDGTSAAESHADPASDQSSPQGVFKNFKSFSAEMKRTAEDLHSRLFLPFFCIKLYGNPLYSLS